MLVFSLSLNNLLGTGIRFTLVKSRVKHTRRIKQGASRYKMAKVGNQSYNKLRAQVCNDDHGYQRCELHRLPYEKWLYNTLLRIAKTAVKI
jgi:hypothetical protein